MTRLGLERVVPDGSDAIAAAGTSGRHVPGAAADDMLERSRTEMGSILRVWNGFIEAFDARAAVGR